jgi:hypothetical protein
MKVFRRLLNILVHYSSVVYDASEGVKKLDHFGFSFELSKNYWSFMGRH